MIQVVSWIIVSGLALTIAVAMNALYVDSLRRRVNELENEWERGW